MTTFIQTINDKGIDLDDGITGYALAAIAWSSSGMKRYAQTLLESFGQRSVFVQKA
jgi:hypothetical protein